MIFGPVMAIPAAIISDTVGFMIFPTGDYFLPFMLTEIASTVIYSLLLYRARVSPIRVTLARFLICLLVNVLLPRERIQRIFQILSGGRYKPEEHPMRESEQ